MKKLYTLLFCFSLITQINAQREETVFNHNGEVRFTGFWLGNTNAVVDFDDGFSLNSGGFFAFELNNDFLIGWAGYKSDLTKTGQNIEIKGNDLLLGYTFRSDRVIHPMVYMQAGGGKLVVEDIGTDRVFVAQPTFGVEANIARFFRLGVDAGYRFVSGNDLPDFNNDDLTGPVLNLRLKFGWSWR